MVWQMGLKVALTQSLAKTLLNAMMTSGLNIQFSIQKLNHSPEHRSVYNWMLDLTCSVSEVLE